MKYFIKSLILILLFPLLTQAQSGVDTLSLKTIFYEPLLAGHRPGFSAFTPDLSDIYYQGNDSAKTKEKFYTVDLNGQNKDTTSARFEPRFSVSPDGQKLTYSDEGDIWTATADFTNKKRLVNTKLSEYDPTWDPESHRIAYIQEGDAWILNTQTSELRQVTNKQEEAPDFSIIDWAGNDKLVLSQWDTSDYEEYYFPEYLGQHVKTGATKRGVATQRVSVAYLDSSEIELMYEQKGYLNTDISSSGRYLAVDELDAPMKNRKIIIFDLEEPKATTVFKDSTDGWLYGTDLSFAPEGDKLMFFSEQDGWNHIYSVDPDGSNLQQHTEGDYEIAWAEWISGNEIVLASTETDPGERHIYTLDIRNNETEKLTSRTGFRQNFELSRDHRHLVYEYTYFNEPTELYTLDLENPQEIRLTHTIPDRFKEIDWQEEDYIRFTGRDGETELSMSVLEPLNIEPDQDHPVVVFVHGAGSLQNVYKGWSNNYYREYMFHQYLTARGYYVIEVDYRHSTGYGRKFREDVTNWMGKYETKDIIDGLDYLAEHYPEADTSNVGIYGGSYGGFMALYATSVAPEYFDAAAALRAVTNWENYYNTNPWYTLPRLGKPDQDSTHYERSSPISYVDQLEDPVLILHGLTDNNVGFQDAAQYIEKLVQAGDKEFEMMMYPSERHSFEDPDAWYDEYSRIFEFFEEHLK